MKKIFILIILIFSFFYSVLNVYAENAVINDISIKEVRGSVYTEEPSVTNDLIQAKTVFKEINDSVTYQISLNFDNALYRIGSVIDSNQNDNISTNYSYQNDKLFMTLVYHDEIDSSLNLEDINVQVTLEDAYVNPVTGNDYTMLYLCFMIMGILTFCIVYNKKKELTFLILFLPLLVNAKDDQVLKYTFSGSQIGVGCDVNFGNSMDSIVCVYGQECEVPAITYTMDNQFLIGWSTSDGGGLVYYADEISIDKTIFSSKNIILYPVWSDKKILFEYKGYSETYTIYRTGSYKLEVWGAQGGGADTYSGGKGGYSTGIINLNSGTTLYIYVGEQGSSDIISTSATAGTFGGGGGVFGSTTTRKGTGGGASDIRIGEDSLYARVIVAGGGGGASNNDNQHGYGGAGGGINGCTAYSTLGDRIGGVGSQTGSGYAPSDTYYDSYYTAPGFGIGGTTFFNSASGGGGGGGWYGGWAAGGSGAGGSGGSGYVYSESTASYYPSGCLLNGSYYLSDAETIDGNQVFASIGEENETGHSGNGYARITYLG